MNKRVWIALGVLAVLLLIVGNLALSGERGEEVTAARVERGQVVSRVSAAGKIFPVTEVKITSQVSARIERLAVREGQRVQRGDVLVELDRTLYVARVEGARAALNSAQANAAASEASLRQAEDALSIEKQKAEQGIGIPQVLRDAQNNRDAALARRDAARAQVASARSSLDQAQEDLARTTIRAPMAGTVTALAAEEGEMVLGTQMTMGSQIMAVSDLSQMEVEVDVDETDVVSVDLGQEVEVEVDALPGQVLVGRVTEIANAGTTTGRGTQMEVTNFTVKALLSEGDPRLRPGMSAAVDVITAVHDDVVYLPIQALTARRKESASTVSNTQSGTPGSDRTSEEEYEEVVFVISPEGRVQKRPVQTGIAGTTRIEILEGVSEGEQVVIGPFRILSRILKDGDPVRILEETTEQTEGENDG